MATRILHIAGTRANGRALEILVVNPEEPYAEDDFVDSSDEVEVCQMIELEGDWPMCPDEQCFKRD